MMNIFYVLKNRFKAFTRCEQGVGLIEFAFALPLLLILFYGAVEVSRYLLIIQKMEDMIFEITDVTSQIDPATTFTPPATFQSDTCSRMSSLTKAVKDMMSPYTDTSSTATNPNIVVYISDVVADPTTGTPTVEWQYKGGGTLNPASPTFPCTGSCIGTAGGTANLTAAGGLVMAAGSEIIVGEVFYQFTPILASHDGLLNSTGFYSTGLYRNNSINARYYYNGTLAAFNPTACP